MLHWSKYQTFRLGGEIDCGTVSGKNSHAMWWSPSDTKTMNSVHEKGFRSYQHPWFKQRFKTVPSYTCIHKSLRIPTRFLNIYALHEFALQEVTSNEHTAASEFFGHQKHSKRVRQNTQNLLSYEKIQLKHREQLWSSRGFIKQKKQWNQKHPQEYHKFLTTKHVI